MLLKPAKERRPLRDDSFIGPRVGVLLLIALILFGVLGFRLWFLQIMSGDSFALAANENRVRETPTEAPRGVIFDRNGQVLVRNRGGLNIGLLRMNMPDPKKESQALGDEFSRLSSLLGVRLPDLKKAYDDAGKEPYVVKVVKEDVARTPVVDYLKEHSTQFPGVSVETSFLRDYPSRALATHLLGYVGEVSQDDQSLTQFKLLPPGSNVGKNGIERTYDSFLRGTNGKSTVEVDSAGRPKRFLEKIDPLPGNNVVLTIDIDLQKAAEDALAEGVQLAQKRGFANATGGAVVAMDPRNGQILAMASYPTYDPSLWVGGMDVGQFANLNAPAAHNPFMNRAISGLYPAGSTFKPYVATAALNVGLVTPQSTFASNGSFKAAGHTWKDWNPEPRGDVNLAQALEQSVDVYFYNLGNLLYQQTGPVLQNSLRQFGFGRQSGIDLSSENAGRVPDKDWKAQNGRNAEDKIWKPGDDINLAVGQGDLLVTPLQLAVAMSAIANATDVGSNRGTGSTGIVWVPKLGLRITDPSGNVLDSIESEKRSEVSWNNPRDLAAIRQGLRLVVSDPTGTAYAAFKGFSKGVPVAGKTGTAQKKPDDDYAWFTGYAPYIPSGGSKQPEIVVVALIEQGGHGSSVAAPVVRRVLEAYFHTESKDLGDIKPTE